MTYLEIISILDTQIQGLRRETHLQLARFLSPEALQYQRAF